MSSPPALPSHTIARADMIHGLAAWLAGFKGSVKTISDLCVQFPSSAKGLAHYHISLTHAD